MSVSVIEHLPQELRDRFTEMRELDLSVQSKFDEKIVDASTIKFSQTF